MQNFESDSGNTVSPQEAQEILAAWTNKRQARGVDPGVGSVTALATGLGVSEYEIRQMLEDIRVQHRSQQLAAGIVDQQLKHRKRSDVTAAMIAAAVIIALVLFGGAFMMFRGSGAGTLPPEAAPDGIPTQPLPPTPEPGGHNFGDLSNSFVQDDNSVIHTSPTHGVTNIDRNAYIRSEPNGTTNLSGQPAVEAIKKRIIQGKEVVSELDSKKELSTADQAEKSYWEGDKGEIRALQEGLKLLESTTNQP